MAYLKEPPSERDHFLGNLEAPLILVEYGDYECPHSIKAWQWVQRVRAELNSELCYVYRHYPLTDIHLHSGIAAMAAEVAGSRNMFWEMHDLLLSRDGFLTTETIMAMAVSLGITEEVFMSDLDREDIMNRVCYDISTGEDSEVKTTPAFFINGLKLEGPLSLEILRDNLFKVLGGHHLSA